MPAIDRFALLGRIREPASCTTPAPVSGTPSYRLSASLKVAFVDTCGASAPDAVSVPDTRVSPRLAGALAAFAGALPPPAFGALIAASSSGSNAVSVAFAS